MREVEPRVERRAGSDVGAPVVGSSAMSTAGSRASAIAIMTRCRIPPESWCGYSA